MVEIRTTRDGITMVISTPSNDAGMATTEEVLNAYREANAAGNLDRVVELHAEDAVLISRGHVRRGHAEIREHYEELSELMSDPEMDMELFDQIIEGDYVQFTYSMETSQFTWDFAVDTVVIQDGNITGHTVAVYSEDE